MSKIFLGKESSRKDAEAQRNILSHSQSAEADQFGDAINCWNGLVDLSAFFPHG